MLNMGSNLCSKSKSHCLGNNSIC